MIDQKYVTVPVEPTEEMLSAASGGSQLWGEVAGECYRAMLAAAPDVQGEPVVITDADILVIAGRVESCPVSPWWLKDDVAIGDVQAAVLRFARALLVAAPQPEEQQPDVTQLVEALETAYRYMQAVEVQIDGEWGSGRDFEELGRDGDLDPDVIFVQNALAAHKKEESDVK